jgi:hypothetical protein
MSHLPVPLQLGHRLPPDRYSVRRPNLARCGYTDGWRDASFDIDRKPE